MRRLLPIKLLALSCLLAACVTVNVYFPAAAAEQAADRIIDTVTSQQQKSNEDTAPKTPPNSRVAPTSAQPTVAATSPLEQPMLTATSVRSGQLTLTGQSAPAEHSVRTEPSVLLATVGAALNFLIPAAQAQGSPNLDVSGPEIRAVTASMQQRFGQLQKYFQSGVIGLTTDGLVAVRDQSAVPLTERAVVTRLVTEDNRDRETLYAELAKANKHPEWEPDIRRTFARRWVERGAQGGWYYQDNGGKWVQK
jgi:uncharacterized protein YdbL (DUF1318 family)